MKLVEILARDVSEWSEGNARAVQEGDGWVFLTIVEHLIFKTTEETWSTGGTGRFLDTFGQLELADDYQTTIVTREQWEAARSPNYRSHVASMPTIEAHAFVGLTGRDDPHDISLDRAARQISRNIAAQLDQQTRDQLIAIGWMPPEEVQALCDLLNRSTPA